MARTVFNAFPKAIISNDWKLGELIENTEVGKLWHDLGYKSVIVDEGDSGEINRSPNAEGITSDTLIYAMPSQIQCANVAKLISSYYWFQESTEQYYRIIEVGIGKNQQNGVIEHIEFRIRPTELAGEYNG